MLLLLLGRIQLVYVRELLRALTVLIGDVPLDKKLSAFKGRLDQKQLECMQ